MRPRLYVLCALAMLFLVACGNLFDTAAAVVGGQKITIAEVTAALDEYKEGQEYERLSQQGNIAAIERQVQQAILSELIRRAVMEAEAEDLGIEVTEEEVAEQIDRIREDIGSQSAFEEQLKESGFTLERLEQRIHDTLLENKIREEVTADAAPSEEDIAAFYEENVGDFTETQLQHILVDDPALAQQLSAQLQDAPAKKVDKLFEELARRHSTDRVSAKEGGDLGAFDDSQLAEQLGEPVATAVANLEPGEVADPVRSEAGYHVIRVLEREALPLEAVTPAITERLGSTAEDEAWQRWVKEAYEAADIRVNSRYGELDIEAQLVVDATAEDVPGAVSSPSPSQTP